MVVIGNTKPGEDGATGSSQMVSSYSIDSLSEDEDDNQLGGKLDEFYFLHWVQHSAW